MKKLIPSLRSALAPCYEGDELQTVVKALCCELLGFDEYTYYLKEDVTLSEDQTSLLVNGVRRLLRGEPLQYVLGNAPFAGFSVKVDGNVLIPRPETGQLIRLALEQSSSRSFLDVGTGSGCIALALAKADGGKDVVACDVSEEALSVARSNAEANHADIRFVKADVLSIVTDGRLPDGLLGVEVDGIVSNPPYIRQCEHIFMEERVLGWEPTLALFVPDDDPLLFYRALALLGQSSLLRPGGALCVEINRDFGFETATLFHLYGYEEIRVIPDLFGNERFVTCKKKA